MACEPQEAPEFDAVADDYDIELNKGLALTGESKEYFATGRMKRLRQLVGKLRQPVGSALDFGCGTGGSTSLFFDILGSGTVLGVDPSEQSLAVARGEQSGRAATFFTPEAVPDDVALCDIAFCNGVFHHIAPAERADAVRFVFEKLKPGGMFAFWENNAWNPATRYLMARVPFDKDAVLLFPKEARQLLRTAGFEILATEFHFIFPKLLSALRRFEPLARRVPFGGQYLVLARRP